MASAVCSAPSVSSVSLKKEFLGAKALAPKAKVSMVPVKSRSALTTRADYLGSPTNLIMVTSITLSFVSGRFGLAPAANRPASAGLKLSDRETGLDTRDPAGFTGTDVLAFGAIGHVLGAGIVLALKYFGSI